MTDYDKFALAAMSAMLRRHDDVYTKPDFKEVATQAYMAADAMMAEREARGERIDASKPTCTVPADGNVFEALGFGKEQAERLLKDAQKRLAARKFKRGDRVRVPVWGCEGVIDEEIGSGFYVQIDDAWRGSYPPGALVYFNEGNLELMERGQS